MVANFELAVALSILGAFLSLPALLTLFGNEIFGWAKNVLNQAFWWRWERRRRRALRDRADLPVPKSLRGLNERAREALGSTMVTCEEFGRHMEALGEAMRRASVQPWWR